MNKEYLKELLVNVYQLREARAAIEFNELIRDGELKKIKIIEGYNTRNEYQIIKFTLKNYEPLYLIKSMKKDRFGTIRGTEKTEISSSLKKYLKRCNVLYGCNNFNLTAALDAAGL